jgi:eukaryotic-like serine/threonine-protein kinase
MKRPLPFGKYLLLERINVGGMAEVFCAKAFGVEGFERILAIKKILPTMVEDDEFIQMFIDEARISVLLNHANIVQIHELGQHDENYYIAMEYVSGKDLRAILEQYRRRKEIMPTAQAVYIASRICDGLDHAHRKKDARGSDLNIIHRDVSPQNILISYEGDVKIIDFGIAKAANRAQKTQAGILKGKFGYMSPEQVRGLPIDRRSDIFAVGVIMYEMLTGERLFVGESDFSTLEKVRNAEVVPPREYNSNIPVALEKVVLKSLAREVEDRYQWSSDLQEALMRFLLAGDAIYSGKHLSMFMKESFAEDLAREQERMERFAQIQRPDQVETSGVIATLPKQRAKPASVPDRAESGTDPEGTSSAESPLPPDEPTPDVSDKTEIFNPNAAQPEMPVAAKPSHPSLPSIPAAARRPSGRIPAANLAEAQVAEGGTVINIDPPKFPGTAPEDAPPADPTVSVSAAEVAATVIGAPAFRAQTSSPGKPIEPIEEDENLDSRAGETGEAPLSGEDQPDESGVDEVAHGGNGADAGEEEPEVLPTQIGVRVQSGRRANGASADMPGSRMAPMAVAAPVQPFKLSALLQKPYIYFLAAGAGFLLVATIVALAVALRKPKPGVLIVHASPAEATVTVDGHPAPSGQVPVMPGRHSITVTAVGFRPIKEKLVQVEPGGVAVESIALLPEMTPETLAPPPENPPAPPPPAATAIPAPSPTPPAKTGSLPEPPSTEPTGTKANPPATEPEVATTAEPPRPRVVKKFMVSFASEPDGAEVRVAGRTLKTPAQLELDATRSHTARFSLKGYKPETLVAKDDGSGQVALLATMAKLPEAAPKEVGARHTPRGSRCKGTLVTGAAITSEVFVDGKSTNRWTPIAPGNPLEIDAGDHVVGYRTQDGKTAKRQVTMKCGEQAKLLGVNDFK